MTKILRNNKTAVSKSAFTALLTPVTQADPQFTVPENIYRTFRTAGAHGSGSESQEQLLFHAGQVIRQSDIDAAFRAGSFASKSPSTGPAAGGTVVTIKGDNLGGATGVTFGGTAGTAFSVVDDNTVKVTTPAKTAGAHAVVVADDSGNVACGNFTYA
jgi:IPT/TIG domain